MYWQEALRRNHVIGRREASDGIDAMLQEDPVWERVGIVVQHPGERPIQATRIPRPSARRVLEELNVPLEGWQ
jgi:hypothetical protein